MIEHIIFLNGINEQEMNKQYFVEIGDNTFIFNVLWNFYSQTAHLSITDYDDNPIISGLALVNNLKIRNNNLPYTFIFKHVNDETYEPTLENISSEFGLYYYTTDDEV